MSDMEIEELCNLFEKYNFDEDEYERLLLNRYILNQGIPNEYKNDFLSENDKIIQNYLKSIELSDIDFLREMMVDYLSMSNHHTLIQFKLDMLSAIYNSIYDILNS